MAITMKDIARDLGVSVVTVSKVLRNHSDISAKTRKRVQQRMKELNYLPNPSARALHSGRTNLIGLIVPDLVHPFFSLVAKGISVWLRAKKYGLIISSSEDDPQLENSEIQQMLTRRVDALILASTQSNPHSLRKIEQQGVPFILLDRKVPHLQANFVGIDDFVAGEQATNHLIEVGCKTIAHIAGPKVSTALNRLAGYTQTLAKHGLTLPAPYVVSGRHMDDRGDAAGYAGMKQLLQCNPLPDGVFCANDAIAIGAMRAILEAGLKIPQEIAVVGCGNLHYDDFLLVPLTSIDQDSSGLGASAAELAFTMIKDRAPCASKTILLRSKLVIRASSQRRM